MSYNTFNFEIMEPGLGLITLNRPDRLNAINLEMLSEFHALYESLRENDEVRVLILTGAGRGFSAGADLMDAQMLEEAGRLFADAAIFLRKVQKVYSNMILEMRRLPQPIIAAVNGVAAGGGFTMVLASDVIYATPKAKFIPSFINLGLSGGELGTSYYLPRLVGSARAAEILMTGRAVRADEAEKIGLVNKVVEEDALIDTARATAQAMLGKSLMGLRLTKETLQQNQCAPSLEAAMELENRNQAICAFTGDFQKAVEAFVTGKKE